MMMIHREQDTAAEIALRDRMLASIRQETREYAVRIAMLTDVEFMAGVARGEKDFEEGRTLTLEELDRKLGLD